MFAQRSKDELCFVQKLCELLLYIPESLAETHQGWHIRGMNICRDIWWNASTSAVSRQRTWLEVQMQLAGNIKGVHVIRHAMWPWYWFVQYLSTHKLEASWSTRPRRVLQYGMACGSCPYLQHRTFCYHFWVPCWTILHCGSKNKYWQYWRGDWIVEFDEMNHRLKTIIANIQVKALHVMKQHDLVSCRQIFRVCWGNQLIIVVCIKAASTIIVWPNPYNYYFWS